MIPDDRLVFGDEVWIRDQIPGNGGVWWWALPDMLRMGHVRECAQPATVLARFLNFIRLRATGCPAVLRFGNFSNPTYSDTVPLTKVWQLFLGNLLALSEYGRRLDDLDRDEHAMIGKAYRNVYGDHLALCNNSGYNDIPRADYVNNIDTDKKDPTFDQVRGFATNSYRGELVENMVRIQSFDWASGPPASYGVEILDHPAVQVCTNQYSGGAVGKFPYLSGDVPTALITKAPVYYYAKDMQRYEGARRAPYWKSES